MYTRLLILVHIPVSIKSYDIDFHLPFFVAKFFGSILLQNEHQENLHEWIGTTKGWQLIYKATRDGFGASEFHSACDGKGENLGIIKSQNV